MDDLVEREKELDCLYQLSHLLVEFQGDESLLLEKAVPLLKAAMSNPEGCEISLEISAETEVVPKHPFSCPINNRETLVLKIRFSSPHERTQEREVSLLRSALELLTGSINRMRLENKILAKNHALGELIEQLSEAKHERTRDMEKTLNNRIFPALERFRAVLPRELASSLDVLKSGMREMVGADSRPSFEGLSLLSPREREICGFIQSGMDTKSIADLLNISPETVERHRCTIRKKIGLTGTGQTLHQYLLNL